MKDNDINLIIANNLKRIRFEKGLSLEEVAALTNVSKSMINRIECAKSVPSVTTLWKIAGGLKISFSALVDEAIDDMPLLEKNNISVIKQKKFTGYSFIPYNSARKFEMFYVELEAHGKHVSITHKEALFEYVFVTQGILELDVNDSIIQVKEECMYKFNAKEKHAYYNNSDEIVKAVVLITYL